MFAYISKPNCKLSKGPRFRILDSFREVEKMTYYSTKLANIKLYSLPKSN